MGLSLSLGPHSSLFKCLRRTALVRTTVQVDADRSSIVQCVRMPTSNSVLLRRDMAPNLASSLASKPFFRRYAIAGHLAVSLSSLKRPRVKGTPHV